MPPALWGSERRLAELFPGLKIKTSAETFNFRYRSARHWLDVFRTYYGPTNRAFAALEGEKQKALEADILDLIGRCQRPGGSGLVVPSAYLEVVMMKA